MLLNKEDGAQTARSSEDAAQAKRRPYQAPTVHSAKSALLDLACVSCGTSGSPDCPACDLDTTPV
ncbi:MAG: hypothetical protein HY902_07010 [Deltaproteobacteria bacterium]|nr:hypothetical protein [Deltaproteobacteria bacterium]